MLGGSKTATLLLFHESAQRSSVPEACRMSRNVEVNEVGDGGIAALHARRIYEAMGYQDQGQAGELQQKLARLFDIAPACLPEFKPSWGWVFTEYLNDYSHWTYTDADVVFGRFATDVARVFVVCICVEVRR